MVTLAQQVKGWTPKAHPIIQFSSDSVDYDPGRSADSKGIQEQKCTICGESEPENWEIFTGFGSVIPETEEARHRPLQWMENQIGLTCKALQNDEFCGL